MSSGTGYGVAEQRGIPGVQSYLTQSYLDVNNFALPFLQQNEYKWVGREQDFSFAKIPDIEKCLDVVATLQAKRGYWCSEEKYSQACVEETDSVCLWLGPNVMSEYSLEEAIDLLQNQDNAKASLEVLATDIQFLRDQVTLTPNVHRRKIIQAGAITAQKLANKNSYLLFYTC
ncbi:hypothetical protein JHK82_046486 [Glycine max]|nr:hypothetical protein JHK86_046384 [Glycine max]KAG4932161.1 hypothetical protein JHK87_046163 [Glycine soja]KAG4942286.1 hypothetical protein JHK85_046932 [Glycine max]KAG5096632.1 hypothetical protein JHK82_046486 [Glycine max]KAG5101421.1 hypothetical protein JHK84_046390 [Glycine max]